LTEPTPSHANCPKTRRLPPVGCTTGEQRPSSFRKETGAQWEYTAKWQTYKPYKAVETHNVAVPRCTLVSGPDDPSIGGRRLGAMTPFRKLYPLSDRVCPRQMTITSRRRFQNGRDAFLWLTPYQISPCNYSTSVS